jgi:hypothetical protein
MSVGTAGMNVRQIFLILHRVASRPHSTATVGTPGRERRCMALVDLRRNGPMRLSTMGGTRLSTGAARAATWGAARKWGRLSMQRASSDIQRLFEPMNLTVQPIAFASQLIALSTENLDFPFQIRTLPIGFGPLATQSIDLSLLPFAFGDQIVTRDRAPARGHALVMPRFSWKYKRMLRRSHRLAGHPRATTRKTYDP